MGRREKFHERPNNFISVIENFKKGKGQKSQMSVPKHDNDNCFLLKSQAVDNGKLSQDTSKSSRFLSSRNLPSNDSASLTVNLLLHKWN